MRRCSSVPRLGAASQEVVLLVVGRGSGLFPVLVARLAFEGRLGAAELPGGDLPQYPSLDCASMSISTAFLVSLPGQPIWSRSIPPDGDSRRSSSSRCLATCSMR
jgi:hypothetical protein